MKKSEVKVIAIILSIIIGIILGILLDKLIFSVSYFTIDKNINLLHLLSILSPIAVGIYINIIINRKNEQNSSAKKMLTEKLSEIENQLICLIEIIENNNFNIHIIINKITNIKRGFLLLKDYKIFTPDECSKLLESFNQAKDKVTVSSETVKISDNIVSINKTVVSEVSDSINRIKDSLFSKKMQVINEVLQSD